MPREIILTPEALGDAQEAYRWYEAQLPGLGDQFFACMDVALFQIAQNPSLFPIRFDSFRRILIRRFPFAVYYDFTDKSVVIYYIFHCAQDPAKLVTRLRKSP